MLEMMAGYIVLICWLAIHANYTGVNAIWQSWLRMLSVYAGYAGQSGWL
jgi:hypothetical protein